jgi:hypothetical protein
MVTSLTTNCKATKAGSSVVFEDNAGEDEFSSQSTYTVNIDCSYYKAFIVTNQKMLIDLKPSKQQLETACRGMVTAVNELHLQIASKKPFLMLIVKAEASILIMTKFKPKIWFLSS